LDRFARGVGLGAKRVGAGHGGAATLIGSQCGVDTRWILATRLLAGAIGVWTVSQRSEVDHATKITVRPPRALNVNRLYLPSARLII